MKVETLRKIAREYRAVADRKLDDKELCKGFSAQAADDRDGGHRVSKIVEKADFASSYADLLNGKDEQVRKIRSSSAPAPEPAQKPVERASAPVSIPARATEIDTSIPSFLARTA